MRSLLSIPIFLLILLSSFTQVALAQDFFVFPRQGQSNEQLQRDKVECQIWARQQTGFDPLQTPTASAPPPAASGSVVGGAAIGGATGAAAGVVGGAIAGNVGRGAAIGAASGALLGGMARSGQNRREAEDTRQWARQESATQAAARDRFPSREP